MGNLIVFYGKGRNIKKIVAKYQEIYNATTYEITTQEKVSFLDKVLSTYSNSKIAINRPTIALNSYETIILVSNLWFDKVPNPVLRFLEQQTGKIKKIVYILYNNNKDDRQEEFDKMDKILNLRREKSYFVTVHGKDINVRVYQ